MSSPMSKPKLIRLCAGEDGVATAELDPVVTGNVDGGCTSLMWLLRHAI